jgi:dienelactone hydrolase
MTPRPLLALALATLSFTAAPAQQPPRALKPGDVALREDVARQRLVPPLPDNPGTGPYPAIKLIDPAFPDHVVYRPRDLAAVRRPLAILIWGNGGCRADGASSRLFLEEIASHGFLVVAPGRILSGAGIERPTSEAAYGHSGTADVLAGIDLARAANAAPGPYRGRLDLTRIAAAGTSCGGLQALQAAADPRVRAVVGLHTGFFNDDRAPVTGQATSKAQLKALHTPVLYILGGPRDIAEENGQDDFDHISHVSAMVASHPVGHLGTFDQANGGAEAQVTLRWLQWQLDGDAGAARLFAGKSCGLCSDPAWTVRRKGL